MGLTRTGMRAALARMTEIQRPTSLPGTKAGMGWFITSTGDDQVVWKSGLSMGCNTFIGYSQRERRGAILLGNFLWQPLDAGTISLGVRLIKPGFPGADFDALYVKIQTDAHIAAVGLYAGYAQNGQAGAIKDHATKTLPTLKMHYDMVLKLKASG